MTKQIRKFENMGRTIRRYYVDQFYATNVNNIASGSTVLDLGGNKIKKRGQFNLDEYEFNTIYANLSLDKTPDIQIRAEYIPIKNDHFDLIICSELLEHVLNPPKVLNEIYRVMKVGGKVLITVPFLYNIHADPHDYGRYTNTYWENIMESIGFKEITITKQGAFFSVLVDMMRAGANVMNKNSLRWLRWLPTYSILNLAIGFCFKRAINFDSKPSTQNHLFYGKYTTGFGISAEKK